MTWVTGRTLLTALSPRRIVLAAITGGRGAVAALKVNCHHAVTPGECARTFRCGNPNYVAYLTAR